MRVFHHDDSDRMRRFICGAAPLPSRHEVADRHRSCIKMCDRWGDHGCLKWGRAARRPRVSEGSDPPVVSRPVFAVGQRVHA